VFKIFIYIPNCQFTSRLVTTRLSQAGGYAPELPLVRTDGRVRVSNRDTVPITHHKVIHEDEDNGEEVDAVGPTFVQLIVF
jgi:hypothetical protein